MCRSPLLSLPAASVVQAERLGMGKLSSGSLACRARLGFRLAGAGGLDPLAQLIAQDERSVLEEATRGSDAGIEEPRQMGRTAVELGRVVEVAEGQLDLAQCNPV